MKKKICCLLCFVLFVTVGITGISMHFVYAESTAKTIENDDDKNADVKIGEIIRFGKYEQDGDETNGPEPIEWRVLAIEDGKALVISEYALDAKPYNTENVDITWEECTLRSWLNDDFYQAAFSEEEQDWIALTQVINEDNPDYNTEGGNDTEDKVFLLSIAEANEYFADDEGRKVYATQYAKDNGAYVSVNTSASGWWLRSPGSRSRFAADVFTMAASVRMASMSALRLVSFAPLCGLILKHHI